MKKYYQCMAFFRGDVYPLIVYDLESNNEKDIKEEIAEKQMIDALTIVEIYDIKLQH